MIELKPGMRAPFFELPDQDGKPVSLGRFRGRKLLLYFFPKADTPGCTAQACCLRDAMGQFDAKNCAIVGVSSDKPGALKNFAMKHGFKFPLLSDREHVITKRYGAWGRRSMYGKKYMGPIRSAVLIDENARVVEVWYKIRPDQTAAEALKVLK